MRIDPSSSKLLALAVLAAAAVLEVGGDALIRAGLLRAAAARAVAVALVIAGAFVLASYGVVVNLLALDFSRLLGAYVGLFAAVSVAVGALAFGERVAPSTWVGLGVILVGSFIIQYGAWPTR